MHVLSFHYALIRLCGLWRPREWSDGWKKCVYDVYTFLIVITTYTFAMSEVVAFFMALEDIDEIVNNSFMTLTIVGTCGKTANLLYHRDEIRRMIDVLDNELCAPRGPEEIAVKLRFDDRGRRGTMVTMGLGEAAVVSVTILSLLKNVPERSLPFEAWLPFDHTNPVGYWIAFVHQTIGHGLSATIGSVYDALLNCTMAQTCAQLNILKWRLQELPKQISRSKINDKHANVAIAEKREIENCVRHHCEIFKFVKITNDLFGVMIFVQFTVSTIVICSSTYALSKMNLASAEFGFVMTYLSCMLAQIFLMCWNGNEVMTESMDIGTAVYEMDWECLEESTKRDLRMIMVRSLDPIKYTSGHVITLSLDSYNSLMKMSYSVYNLMQQTSSTESN